MQSWKFGCNQKTSPKGDNSTVGNNLKIQNIIRQMMIWMWHQRSREVMGVEILYQCMPIISTVFGFFHGMDYGEIKYTLHIQEWLDKTLCFWQISTYWKTPPKEGKRKIWLHDFMLFSYGFSFLFFPLQIHDLNIAWMAANCKQWLLNFCLLWCYLCSVVAFDLLVGCLTWQFFLRDWNGKWGCDSYKVEACKLTERKTKKYVI